MDNTPPSKRSKTSNRDNGTTSLIERLPREIINCILDVSTMKSILNLRSTSRLIKPFIDEYSMIKDNIPIVNRLTVFGPTKNSSLFGIGVSIRRSTKKLFYLRLIRDCPPVLLDKKKGLKRLFVAGEYQISFANAPENFAIFDYLNECFGKRIDTVELRECNDQTFLQSVSHLLGTSQIGKLDVHGPTISIPAVNYLCNALDANNVENITLNVQKFADIDPAQALVELSSHVRSIHLCYTPKTNKKLKAETGKNCLLDVYNVDWAPIFVDMFSRRLDKLKVTNENYEGYLTASSVDTLMEAFPLLGKAVWFESTCHRYAVKNNYEKDGYIVKSSTVDMCCVCCCLAMVETPVVAIVVYYGGRVEIQMNKVEAVSGLTGELRERENHSNPITKYLGHGDVAVWITSWVRLITSSLIYNNMLGKPVVDAGNVTVFPSVIHSCPIISIKHSSI